MTLVPATSHGGGLAAPVAIANLAAGLAGQFVGGTVPSYLYPPGTTIGYDPIVSPVIVSSATEATGTVVIPGSPYTFDGGNVWFHFYTPYIGPGSADLVICNLFEGANQIGRLTDTRVLTTGGQQEGGVNGFILFAPSAGTHTYKVTAIKATTNGTVGAGAGGTAGYAPCFLRSYKA
jgi:hypothetical protein